MKTKAVWVASVLADRGGKAILLGEIRIVRQSEVSDGPLLSG